MIRRLRIDRRVRGARPAVAAEVCRLEALESRILLSAVRAGFDANTLARGDDISSAQVDIGFSLGFFGPTYTKLFVNTNGNVTFGRGLDTFIPFGLITNTGTPIIAPYFADVDTTNPASGRVTYGSGSVDGHLAFGVTWWNVGYYGSHVDKLNSFQLVLIDRSDTEVGNFDIEFNYDQVQWETGDVGGHNGMGGEPARVGFSNGSGTVGTMFEQTGSGVSGAFLDDNLTTGLRNNALGSEVPGRYVFGARDGVLSVNHAPVLNFIGTKTFHENSTLTFTASATDSDQDSLMYSLLDAPAGASIDPTTGVFSWTPSISQGPGDYTFRVRVTDNGDPGLADIEIITVTVLANQAPIAQDGAFNTNENEPTGGTLLAGDPEGNTLTYRLVGKATKGTVTLTDPATGAFLYTPSPNANGTDTFTYRVNDGRADSNIATVTINVAAVNSAPVAQTRSYDTPGGTALWVASTDLVADIDGDPLATMLVAGPSHGTLTWAADGSFTYTPAPDFNGLDTFTYQASDGQLLSPPATVTLRVGGRDGDVVGPRLVALQRFGFHRRPTRLVLDFNKALDSVRASDPANYTVVNAGGDRRLGTRDDVVVPLASASYDAAGRSVTLLLAQRLYLYGRHQVRIVASGPRAPIDLAGNFLDGDADDRPGGDAQVRFGPKALARRSGGPAVRSQPDAHARRPHPRLVAAALGFPRRFGAGKPAVPS